MFVGRYFCAYIPLIAQDRFGSGGLVARALIYIGLILKSADELCIYETTYRLYRVDSASIPSLSVQTLLGLYRLAPPVQTAID